MQRRWIVGARPSALRGQVPGQLPASQADFAGLIRNLIEKGNVFHRIMFAVPRPQFSAVHYCPAAKQCLRHFEAVTTPVLPKIRAGLTPGPLIDGSTGQCLEEIIEGIVPLWPRA